MKKAVVIGAGFAGLVGASLLTQKGWNVTLVERNDQVGGRARLWKTENYTFDMGPSWYLMPEVFERVFTSMGRDRRDYYSIAKLDPAYRVFFEGEGFLDVPDQLDAVRKLFASIEPGGDRILDSYLDESAYKYDIAMREFLYRDYDGVGDFFNRRLLVEGLKLQVFRRLDRHVRRYFKDHRAQKILEYASVFLGSSPQQTPALYSLMSHVDLRLGVWFPTGGMSSVVLGMARLAEESGVKIVTGREVSRIVHRNGRVTAVETTSTSDNREAISFPADVLLNTADYQWAEEHLLEKSQRSYSSGYWRKRIVAPSMLLAYLGMNKSIPELAHHNLYFSRKWDKHFNTIFKRPSWPENPCWYMSRTTANDSTMAPQGRENIFILVPVAPDLNDSDECRTEYFDFVLRHIRQNTGVDLSTGQEVCRIFSHRDFSHDYHAYKGTALGLSHTLSQTAVFRPGRRSRKLSNLYYAGQYTHPGVGIPMVLISAELAVQAIEKGERPNA